MYNHFDKIYCCRPRYLITISVTEFSNKQNVIFPELWPKVTPKIAKK